MIDYNKSPRINCKKKSIILCSGGIDSVVTANYVKKKLGIQEGVVLFFNYNQPTLKNERRFSKKCALDLKYLFREIKINLDFLKYRDKSEKEVKIIDLKLKNVKNISSKFYIPSRNLLFLSHAISFGESFKPNQSIEIFVGFKNEGKDNYLDTTIDFVNLLNKVIKSSCYNQIQIKAPLIKKDKEDIISLGNKLDINFKNTFSCYNSNKINKHCGVCLACRLRQEGFYWANIKDPTEYLKKSKDFRLAE